MFVRCAPPLRAVLVALVLALGTFALFSRSLGYGFLNYDDPRYILNNPFVQAGFTAESLRWVFAGHGDIWNPLVRLTHILDWRLFGAAAGGHHLHSVLWHSLSAALAFLLLRRLTGAFWTSALCAALFAWHPLRVESVSWISERKDVVSVAFGLLTLLAYTAYAERRATRAPARRAYGVTLLAFAAALLSKPSMVALPGVFLLLDFWPLRRFPFARDTVPAPTSTSAAGPEPLRPLLVEKLPFVLLAGAAAAVAVHTQTAAGTFVLDLPFLARLANAVVSIPRYLGKFFWPFDLSVAYPHPGAWPAWAVAAAALFVLATSALAWRLRRAAPWLGVGWLWFLGTLAPMSGVLQVGFQSMADRYTYFPMLGWQLALLWSLRALAPPRLPRAAVAGFAGLALLGLGVRTWDQQSRWRDSVTLFAHAIASTGPNATAHAFLAYSQALLGRTEEARTQCEQSLAIDPRNTVALYTRAKLDAEAGRTGDAIAGYRTLLAIDPTNHEHALALGHLLLRQGRADEAEAVFRAMLDRDPTIHFATLGLSAVEISRGRPAEAAALLATVLAEEPDNVPCLEQLTLVLHGLGRDEDTAGHFARALAVAVPSDALLRAHAAFLQLTGRTEDALAEFARIVERAPRNAMVRMDHARLLVACGRPTEAIAALAKALELQPGLAAAAHEAGLIHLQLRDTAQAAAQFRRALAADPAHVPALLSLAQLAEKSGNTAEADDCFNRATAAAPASAAPHRLYAEVLARRRQFDTARTHYEQAVALDPRDVAARAGYGYILLLTGERAAALAQWTEALRLDPEFPGLRERVARLQPAQH